MAATEMDAYYEYEEEECTTPRDPEFRIPPPVECPPAPRKKMAESRIKRHPPKNGFFQPPGLDKFFALEQRSTTREACA